MVVLIDDDTQSAMLLGSHAATWTADVFFEGVPTIMDLPLAAAGNVSIDGTAKVQTSGRLYIRSDQPILDRDGNVLAPEDASDFLAPFGQEIVIKRTVSLGSRVFDPVVLCRMGISEVPTIETTRQRLFGTHFVNSVNLEVSMQDAFDKIDADEFTEPASPLDGATTWSEIRRLSSIPVEAVGNDVPVAKSVVYSGNRLDAITLLLANVGLVPHLNRSGVLTARSATPLQDGVIPVDLSGTIQDQTNSLSNRFHNCVVVQGASSGSKQIIGLAQVTSGPLSVYGPMGRRVRSESNPLAVTQGAADSTAATYLQQELSSQAKEVKVNCLPRLDLEAGDVVTATDPKSGRVETGVVSGLDYSLDPTDLMSVTVQVPQQVTV